LGTKMRALPWAALVLVGASAAFAQSPADWVFGVDLTIQDERGRPGDDFFRYTLGSWYAKAPTPPGQKCELLRNMDTWEGAFAVRRFNFYTLRPVRSILRF
jgi:hypothetical protein